MTQAAWRALAEKELAGAGTVEGQAAQDDLGAPVEPVYADGPLDDSAAGGFPGAAPFVRGSSAAHDPLRPWWILSRLEAAAAGTAQAQALEELEGGATGLWLPAEEAGWDGAALRAALSRVHPAAVALALDAGPAPGERTMTLLALAASARASAAGWLLGAEPLRAPASACADLLRAAAAQAPQARALLVDAAPFHEAGAAPATDLALLLAGTAESLRALERAGAAPAAVLGAIAWRLPLERDFFLGVAKLRAARLLWSRLAAACAAPAAPFVHAVACVRSLTRRDAHTNLVRLAVQAAAGAVGGADALSLCAFDAPLGAPSARGRRLARTTQLVLQWETGLGEVQDPAGGSPHLEARTRALARCAWERFRALERDGGLARALQDGSLRAHLEAEWSARRERLAAGLEPVLGVNLHPPECAAPPAPPRGSGPWGLPRRRDEDAAEGAG